MPNGGKLFWSILIAHGCILAKRWIFVVTRIVQRTGEIELRIKSSRTAVGSGPRIGDTIFS